MTRRAPKPWDEAYRRQGRLWRGERLDAPTRRLLDAHPGLRNARWLDAGCGDGKGLVPLGQALEAGGMVVGADASRWGLRRAAEASVERRWPLVQADARHWPFGSASFGAVRAVHILGHLDGPGRVPAAAEMARVLRPRGMGVAVEFGRGDFRYGTGDEVAPHTYVRGVGIPTHYFDEATFRSLIEGAGLRIVALEAERFSVTYEGLDRPRERWWAWFARD